MSDQPSEEPLLITIGDALVASLGGTLAEAGYEVHMVVVVLEAVDEAGQHTAICAYPADGHQAAATLRRAYSHVVGQMAKLS